MFSGRQGSRIDASPSPSNRSPMTFFQILRMLSYFLSPHWSLYPFLIDLLSSFTTLKAILPRTGAISISKSSLQFRQRTFRNRFGKACLLNFSSPNKIKSIHFVSFVSFKNNFESIESGSTLFYCCFMSLRCRSTMEKNLFVRVITVINLFRVVLNLMVKLGKTKKKAHSTNGNISFPERGNSLERPQNSEFSFKTYVSFHKVVENGFKRR